MDLELYLGDICVMTFVVIVSLPCSNEHFLFLIMIGLNDNYFGYRLL